MKSKIFLNSILNSYLNFFFVFLFREGLSEVISTDLSIKDELKRLPSINIKVANNLKQSNKVKAVDLVMGRGNELRV